MNLDKLYKFISAIHANDEGKWGPMVCYDSTIYPDRGIYDVYINQSQDVITFTILNENGDIRIVCNESNYEIVPSEEELLDMISVVLREVKLRELGI